jgi:acetyl esterase/lipase
MLLSRLYMQLGIYLDYIIGDFGLSERLRTLLPNDETSDKTIDLTKAKALVHEKDHRLFPQFTDFSTKSESWPATYLIHGTLDSAVPVEESRLLAQQLKEAGVANVVLVEAEGKEHNFDYDSQAELEFRETWDNVGAWLREALTSNKP